MSDRRMIWLGALAFLATLAAPVPAAAKPTFPCALLDGLNQACPAQVSLQPPCSDCHLGGKTGGATPFTAFAWGMRARGMSGSVESVKTAIAQMKLDGVDSDGDGTPDWQEIIDGTDPNEPGTASNIQDPQLGCAVGGRRAAGGIGAALALAALALVRRGRRRR